MKTTQKTPVLPAAIAPTPTITLDENETVTLSLKGSTVVFIARALEEIPMPRKMYNQLSSDFVSAVTAAKAPKK